MSVIWSDETQQEFDREFWQTKDRWQNQNARFHEEREESPTPLWATRVYVVTGVLVGGYFLSQWAWPFLRALWRAR